MKSIIYLIILSSYVYISVLSNDLFCRPANDLRVVLSNRQILSMSLPKIEFSYQITNPEYSKKSVVSVDNITFTGFMMFPTSTVMHTAAKLTNVKEIRATRELEKLDVKDTTQVCNIVLKAKKEDDRIGFRPEFESGIRSLILPCIQSQLCDSNLLTAKSDIVKDGMKYRKKSLIVEKKLQNTVNAISDFIVTRLLYVITNSYAKIPTVSGYFNYPITGKEVTYEVFVGTFDNIVKAQRVSNTNVQKENDHVNVDIMYELTDINMKFIFKLSDRDYNGTANVSLKNIIFLATIKFDYARCKSSLAKFSIYKLGDMDCVFPEGLVFYEHPYAWDYVNSIVKSKAYYVVKEIISWKVDNFQCGNLQAQMNATAMSWGKQIGQLIGKYTLNL